MCILTLASRCHGEGLYAKGGEHPRLICDAGELTAMRGRLEGPVEAVAYRRLLEKCDAYLDPASTRYVDWEQRKKASWETTSL